MSLKTLFIFRIYFIIHCTKTIKKKHWFGKKNILSLKTVEMSFSLENSLFIENCSKFITL